ncbi:MAG: hypothetical protein JWQ94_1059 [Tardiphaga sp.]|jgi:hypothetical protein|nr:hypothetical protein [Tardiphaga sp.]
MTDTPNLAMPFIDGGQAQKHVTHNEALRILDAAVQLAVLDVMRTAPPPSPVEGQRHAVATGATGAWSGHAKAIATWQDGAWAFLAPRPGWHLWSIADDGLMVYDGAQWRPAAMSVIDGTGHVGINTTADSDNRLSVKSNAVLLSHDDVTPGSGDMRMTLNKAAAGRDAGVSFQDGFSTRALLGNLGDDNFTVKVSPNGSSFFSGLSIDRNSGHVGLNGFTADSNNGLGVKGTAFLFDAETDDCRFTFNKQSAGDDAALTFQTGYAARALIGLLGDEHFSFKVSADAVTFRTALTIDKSSGQVSLELSPKFSAYLNFDKYCAANVFTKVPFNNTRHNDYSAFDAANNQFVAPAAGYYLFGFRIMFKANATVPTTLIATIYRNGAELLDDTRVQSASAVVSNKTMLQSQAVLKLAAGDTISVWAMMETSDGYIAAAQNSFYGHRIA